MGVKTDTPIESQIVLPDDYNPLAFIEQMELLLKFTNKAYNCLPESSENVNILFLDISKNKD